MGGCPAGGGEGASPTLGDDGRRDVDDPTGRFDPASPESLFNTPMPADDGAGGTRRLSFADDPAHWLRNLSSILRSGYFRRVWR
jgi:hypothetical protein